jgi:serine/threonine-protein kinase
MTAVAAQNKALGKYRPIAELGRGGMAVVYLAASQGPRGFLKLVVVKELKEELAGDLDFTGMFVDEARIAARLNHPNIVQTYEVVEEEDKFFLVMEYLEGQAFSAVRTRLSKLGSLTRDHQLRVIVDMLEGLHYAHELTDYDGKPLSLVHRDVSPHNVFVTYAGEVKLVDFGIAKAADSSSHTKTGVIKGKISYMAPEQAFAKKVDRRADIFSAGVMLWEALSGRRMWKGMPDAAIIHHLSLGTIPKIEDEAADVPPELVNVCTRALAANPDERYATAADMKRDLDAYLRALPSPPTAREFGAMLSQAFSTERARITGVIEETMKSQRAITNGGFRVEGLPKLAPDSMGKIRSAPPPVVDPTISERRAYGATQGPDGEREGGPSTRTLVILGVLLVVVGAGLTTALMVPWGKGTPTPAPSATTSAPTATAPASTTAPPPTPTASAPPGATTGGAVRPVVPTATVVPAPGRSINRTR